MERDVPSSQWPIDPSHVGDIDQLRLALPDLPVISSDMRRAADTATFFGKPTVDPRLVEVARPWTKDLDSDVARYFRGDVLPGWEPQVSARSRFEAAVQHHGSAIYVTHATVLTLYLAATLPGFEALGFWRGLEWPDAWVVNGNGLLRLSPRSP